MTHSSIMVTFQKCNNFESLNTILQGFHEFRHTTVYALTRGCIFENGTPTQVYSKMRMRRFYLFNAVFILLKRQRTKFYSLCDCLSD